MDKSKEAILFDKYSKYFIEDFAKDIHNQVKASHPLESEKLNEFVDFHTGIRYSDSDVLNSPNTNTVTRFIGECVLYAIDHDVEDPESREAWEHISHLPSIHHEEIQIDTFLSASQYLHTIDNVVRGLVYVDTVNVVKTIRNTVEKRIEENKSGGHLHVFNWGLLEDGLWLNGAMMTAFNLTSSFRPGEPVVAYHAATCFDYAREILDYDVLSEHSKEGLEGLFGGLVSHAPKHILDLHDKVIESFPLTDVLKYASSLTRWIDYWRTGFSNPKIAIEAIDTLSGILSVLQSVKTIARNAEDESIAPADLVDRIHRLNDVLTLCLVAYEALRETQFSDTLIMSADEDAEDGTTHVYVNNDVLNGFYALHLTDADLIRLGTYLSRLTAKPANGWTLSWAASRYEEILSDMLAEQSERDDYIAAKSIDMVRNIVRDVISTTVMRYLEPKMIDTPPTRFEDDIEKISREVAMGKEDDFNLDIAVFKLLIQATLDDNTVGIGSRFIKHVEAGSTIPGPLAIVESAIEDAHDHIFGETEDEEEREEEYA